MLVVAHVFLAPGLMTVVFLVGVMVVSVILLFQTPQQGASTVHASSPVGERGR